VQPCAVRCPVMASARCAGGRCDVTARRSSDGSQLFGRRPIPTRPARCIHDIRPRPTLWHAVSTLAACGPLAGVNISAQVEARCVPDGAGAARAWGDREGEGTGEGADRSAQGGPQDACGWPRWGERICRRCVVRTCVMTLRESQNARAGANRTPRWTAGRRPR
jgi:hypothetical protein